MRIVTWKPAHRTAKLWVRERQLSLAEKDCVLTIASLHQELVPRLDVHPDVADGPAQPHSQCCEMRGQWESLKEDGAAPMAQRTKFLRREFASNQGV